MRVSIKLAGPLRNHYRGSEKQKEEYAEISDGSTVKDLLDYYNVAEQSVKLITINRLKADMSTALSDGDEVSVIPPAAGG